MRRTPASYARRTKAKAKHQGRQQLRSKLESKALHGKYPQRVKQADVDQGNTHRWLKAAGLKAETVPRALSSQPRIKASQHAGTNTTSSRSLKWTHNVDCVAISTRSLTTWSLLSLNWLKLNISTPQCAKEQEG